MAHTFEEIVIMQRAADEAHARVVELRDRYGSSSGDGWSDEQTATYDKAWQDWLKAAQEVQAAVTAYAKDGGSARYIIEADVKKKVRHPELADD